MNPVVRLFIKEEPLPGQRFGIALAVLFALVGLSLISERQERSNTPLSNAGKHCAICRVYGPTGNIPQKTSR